MMRILALGLAATMQMGLLPCLAAAQSSPTAPRTPGVFVLVTVDKATWWRYSYGSAFFFDDRGDAYTASHVVAEVVKNPGLMLVAIVRGAEYVARVECWNPASPDRTSTFNRDVAIVHVGPDVPLFPLGRYAPAAAGLTDVPLRVRAGAIPVRNQIVRIVGFGDHRAGPVFSLREERGRVTRVLRAGERTVAVTMRFPSHAAPTSGDSGGPILDVNGNVIGMIAWEEERPVGPGTVERSGIAAASFGCVTRIPPGRDILNPVDTPLKHP